MPVKPDPVRAQEIGRRIAQARQEAGGMTQRELAELIGVTDRSIIASELYGSFGHRLNFGLRRRFWL